jgi:hypothetical protein
VNQLPPELLVHIFSFLLPRAWQKLAFTLFIGLTRVCNHWRTVALAAPLLWTVLPAPQPEATSVLLERARTAPLRIVFRIQHTPETVVPLVARTNQACELHINPGRNAQARTSQQLIFKHDAPLLESLRVDGSILGLYGADLPFSREFELPLDMFNGVVPRLRHLALCHIGLGLPFPVLSQLWSLEIHRSHGFADPGWSLLLSVPRFLEALAGMKGLRRLGIDRMLVIKVTEEAAVAHRAVVTLPALRSLKIADHAPALLALTSRIEAPVVECLRISLLHVDDAHLALETFRSSTLFGAYAARVRRGTPFVYADTRNVGEGSTLRFVCWASHDLPSEQTSARPFLFEMLKTRVVSLGPAFSLLTELNAEELVVDDGQAWTK